MLTWYTLSKYVYVHLETGEVTESTKALKVIDGLEIYIVKSETNTSYDKFKKQRVIRVTKYYRHKRYKQQQLNFTEQ